MTHQNRRLVAPVALLLGMSLNVAVLERPEPVSVILCDLLAQPLAFANRRIRVRGRVESGPEYLGVSSDTCQQPDALHPRIWLDVAAGPEAFKYSRGWTMQGFLVASKSGELRGDGPAVHWQVPLPLARFTQEQSDVLSRSLHDATGKQVILTGRFDYAGDGLLVRDGGGSFSFQSAYGHLNCCPARIVVERVDVAGH